MSRKKKVEQRALTARKRKKLFDRISSTLGASSRPESGEPEKSPFDEAIEKLVARGDVEVVGHEKGKPVYYLTEAGLARHALKTGRPIEELRALPELTRRAEELWPSLRRDRRPAKRKKGD
jgi:hypothetical protein